MPQPGGERRWCPFQHNPLAPDCAETLKNLGVGFHQQFPDAEYDVKG
ncbi:MULTISPECIES: hypothetical protein [unclassified Streptomyces]